MKKFLISLVLMMILSLPLLSLAPPVDPATLPVMTWEEVGPDYEIIYLDGSGTYVIVKVNGVYILIEK